MSNDNGYDQDQAELDKVVEENQHIFELKDEIMHVLNNKPTQDCIHALQFALTDLLCSTCTEREAALNVAAIFAMQTGMAITRMDESGLCLWNNEYPVQ